MNTISGATKLACLIGSPVSHSKSPGIYNEAFLRDAFDCVYLCFDIEPKQLKDAITAMRTFNVLGFNVTMPHKTSVMAYLDEITEEARMIGAVNTVKNDNGRLIGYNTDGQGFLKSLNNAQIDYKNKEIAILGAGGAGRSVAVSLAVGGAAKIYIFDIAESKAASLARLINTSTSSKASAFSMPTLPYTAKNSDIFINCTSIGMSPNIDSLPIDPSIFDHNHAVIDVIYDPAPTRLLKEAEEKGARVLDGLGMLKGQAELAYQIYTGVPYET